jgi:hypothetical protein
MPFQPSEFFPDHATWPFLEANTQTKLSIDVKSRASGAERFLDWTLPPESRSQAFFDRMTLSPAGLELNRVRMLSLTLDIRPPLVITAGDQHDHVADLFPNIKGSLGPTSKPYDGTVVFKHLKEILKPGSSQPDLLWSIGIESRGQDRAKVFRALFQFLRSAGLIEYVGDVYGVFFVYRRTDLPEYFSPPQPPQPHQPPVHPVTPPVPASILYQQIPYHVRMPKEVWDSKYDPPLLVKLKARGETEPELASSLVKQDLLTKDDALTKHLRERAKTDSDLAGLLKKHHLLEND